MARERFAAKPKAALELSQAFGIVADSIKQDLLSLTPENYNQMNAMATKTKIDKRLAALASYSARWARRAVANAYAESSGIAVTRLQMLGFKRSRYYSPNQHAQARDKVRGKVTATLVKAIGSMRDMTARYISALDQSAMRLRQIQEFNPGFIPGAVIEDIIQKTIAARKARAYAQKLLMDYLRGLVGTEKYIQVGERMFKVRDYAELVARTELHEAYTEAVIEQAKEYDCDLVQMSQHDSPCEICAPLEGQIFSISGDHPKYPPLTDDVETPLHPNCEHNLNPISEAALNWGN